ncbi:MAG: YihY/virulence factor BrkB family protein [Ilumatobacteraceae bacterium]
MAGAVFARVRSVGSQLGPRTREHHLTLVAAGVAFYAFLAFVPALIAFISIYGLVADPDDVTEQVEDIASALPTEVQDFLVFQLTSIAEANPAGVSITLLIAIVVALWSASGGMAALITGIHVAYERDEPRSLVAKRGKALLLTIGAIALIGVVVFVIAAVPPLLSDAGLGSAGRVIFGIVRWPVLAAVMITGIGLLYRVAVADGAHGLFGIVTPGAVVAMVGWLLVSVLFAVYTATFSSYAETYGALASIVVVLLWLWLSSLLVLIGAEVDGADGGDGGDES